MMTKSTDAKIDKDLSVFFDAAKQTDATLSGALFDRMMSDAATQQDAMRKTPVKQRQSEPLLARFLRSIGGWQVAGSLAACACLGVFAGYSAPQSLDFINGTQSVEEIAGDENIYFASDIEELFLEV